MATKTRVKAAKPRNQDKKDECSFLLHFNSNFEKIDLVKTGISKYALIEMKNHIGMDYDKLSVILGTTKATIHNKKNDERFSASVSEKFVALADIYSFGYKVFEDKERFDRWIQTPNRALGNKIPIELMDTFFGIDEVKNLIGRIEHGVYS